MGRLSVVLSPVPGEVILPPAAWREPPPPGDSSGRRAELVKQAMARRRPLSHLGEDYSNAVVPAMPALDWERVPGGEAAPIWPAALSEMPLLKVPASSLAASHPSALHGVASGVRSALVKLKGQWWRLKGCGNRDQGFPGEAKGDHGEINIRGSCFRHTAETELRVTELARAVLAASGLDCANRTAGSYEYAPEASWPLPKIERQCGIFETLGNARLGDHLLAGILRLLPHWLPNHGDGFAALRTAIAAARGVDPADIWPTHMVISCGIPTADVVSCFPDAHARLGEAVPPAFADMGSQVPENLSSVWDAARSNLLDLLPHLHEVTKEPSLLLWLVWRLGWECGATLRSLHHGGIAWGTYRDALGIHCNAHANNLVVKPPTIGSFPDTFLAALDFDMAFTRDGFIPEASDSQAGFGLDSWDGVLKFEATMGMSMVLGGSDFANTGVANAASVPESHHLAEVAVRDTLVAAYEAARRGEPDLHPHKEPLQKAAYELIKLALCLTTEVEG